MFAHILRMVLNSFATTGPIFVLNDKKIKDKTEIYKMYKFLGGKDREVFVGRRERNNKNEA